MRTLKRYWQKLIARFQNRSSNTLELTQERLEELERTISVISHETHTVSEHLEDVRGDLEQVRSDGQEKISALERFRDEAETSQKAGAEKQGELEQRFVSLQAEHAQAREQAGVLEQSLTNISSQLKTQGDQLKTLQDSTEERARALMSALGDATTRLEIRDNELQQQLGSIGEQVKVLEGSQIKSASRLGGMDEQIKAQEVQIKHQEDQIKTQEDKLESDRQQNQYTVMELRTQMRKQDKYLSWTVLAACLALVLLTIAGAILIREVQSNADMLAGISGDVKDIMRLNVAVLPSESDKDTLLQAEQPTQPEESVSPGTIGAADAETDKTANQPADRPTEEAQMKGEQMDVAVSAVKAAEKQGESALPSGLRYRVIREGSGRTPREADRLVFLHRRILPDGSVHETGQETYPSKMPGNNMIDSIVTEVLPHMNKGAQWELYVPSATVDKSETVIQGAGSGTIVYQIELISIIEADATPGQ